MISIITPTYNRAVLVQTTIKSILAQTFTDWELILVDDGSTDGTEEAVQHFLSDGRIRYIKKANSGQAHSLNVGVSYAQGDFIVFLDSDDEAYPNWLEVVSRHLKEDVGIASAGAVVKKADGTSRNEGLWDWTIYGEKMRVRFTCGSFFIRRSVFNAVGGYDIELKANIQTDLGYRIIDFLKRSQLKSVGIDDYLVQINIHDGPRIRTNWEKTRTGGMQFFKKHFDYFRKYDPDGLSFICGNIAFSNYKLKNRGEAIRFTLKAIKYRPMRLSNYMRIVKYAVA